MGAERGARPASGVDSTPVRGYLPDAAMAAALAGVSLTDGLLASAETGGLGALDSLLLLVGPLALVVRRRAPGAVLLITLVCSLGYGLLVEPGPVQAVPALIAIYTVVAAGHRLWGAAVAALLVAFPVADRLTISQGSVREAIQDAILPVGWFVVAVVLGELARHRDAYLRQVEQRAAEAERTREETALRRAGAERLRIARELHDSLTHSISVIKVQAGVAVHLAGKRGEQVPAALSAILAASNDAVRELRATLDVLRGPGDAPTGTGLDQLPELVDRASSAGLPVRLTVNGPRPALPPDVDRAAYRIVQEALNNVTRHAGMATASVRVDYGDDELTVLIEDDGQASQDAPVVPGIGLVGMRERVSAIGGRLQAGPRPEGGFAVQAEFPVSGTDRYAGEPAAAGSGESR